MGPVHCFLGFSVTYTNTFSEHLERRARELDRAHREGNLLLMQGLGILHEAVDAALAGDAAATADLLERGSIELEQCSERLTSIGENLVRTRMELYERQGIDAADPLIARERCFAAIDYESTYRELAAHGAALPQRVFWDDLANRLRDGGARAGLRLLDRHLRELQSDLRTFTGEVESMRRLPLVELAAALHSTSRAVASIVMGFTRLLTTFTYFSILCERASTLHERGLEQPAAAAAG
jgi:hypothetical protein